MHKSLNFRSWIFAAEWKVWSAVLAYIRVSELESQDFFIVNQYRNAMTHGIAKQKKPLRFTAASLIRISICDSRKVYSGRVKTTNPFCIAGTFFHRWCHIMTAYPKKGRDKPWSLLRDTSSCPHVRSSNNEDETGLGANTVCRVLPRKSKV